MKPHEELSDDELRAAFIVQPNAPRPTTSHLAELRETVLNRTEQFPGLSDQVTIVSNRSAPWVWRGAWLAMATVATVVMLAVMFTDRDSDGAITSFRRVLSVTGSHPWVHGQTRVEFDKTVHEFETWFSPSERLAAMRSTHLIQHTDFNSGQQVTYDRISGRLTRGLANPHSEGFGRALVWAILHNGDLQSAMPFHKVSDLRKSLIAENGAPLLRYQFQAAWRSNASVGWETTIWVDIDSQSITKWEERHSNGTTVLTHFDYPAEGPRNAESLGIPLEVLSNEE